jgi:hypothetical protein
VAPIREKSVIKADQLRFRSIRDRFTRLEPGVKKAPVYADRSKAQVLTRSGSDNIDYLTRLVPANAMPVAYARSLEELDSMMLRCESDTALSAERRLEILEEVHADLVTKTSCAKARMAARGFGADMPDGDSTGAKPGPFDDINVNVRTGVDSCHVWYVLAGWWDTESRFQRFDRLSTPTSQKMTPGNYRIWTSKGDRKGEMLRVSLGSNGEFNREFDLGAP